MDFNEHDKEYIEQTESIDSVMMFKEIKKLNDKVDSIKDNMRPKTDQEKRNEILALKDSRQRQKAISENLELFQGMFNSNR